MLKHINRKNMENCLELQKKFSKDHISGVVMQEDPGTYEKVTNLDISSFEKKSKRESSDLITLEIKKGDKQGLSCSFKGCNYTVTITNKSKAKKKVRKHEETHKNIEMAVSPKGKFADTVTPEGKFIGFKSLTGR